MDPELTRQLINLAILIAGVVAIIWVLRDVFKLAWRVIRRARRMIGQSESE